MEAATPAVVATPEAECREAADIPAQGVAIREEGVDIPEAECQAEGDTPVEAPREVAVAIREEEAKPQERTYRRIPRILPSRSLKAPQGFRSNENGPGMETSRRLSRTSLSTGVKAETGTTLGEAN